MLQSIKDLYSSLKRPLRIADLYCSYGVSSFLIVKEMEKVGVEIDYIKGYDISEELVDLANKKNTSPKISFKKLDVEN